MFEVNITHKFYFDTECFVIHFQKQENNEMNFVSFNTKMFKKDVFNVSSNVLKLKLVFEEGGTISQPQNNVNHFNWFVNN